MSDTGSAGDPAPEEDKNPDDPLSRIRSLAEVIKEAPMRAHVDLGLDDDGPYALAEAELMNRAVYRKEVRLSGWRRQPKYRQSRGRGHWGGPQP